MIVERGVMIPLRDGVRCESDVWRPDTGRVPVLICRTPYGRAMLEELHSPEPLVEAGFAVVHCDCRGRFGSEGEWRPIEVEGEDGYDTVEWAAAQPWSNGRIGMFGASYMGYTQWQTATLRPPHLEAILPETASADYWDVVFGPGGAYRLANRLGWAMAVAPDTARRHAIDDPLLAAVAEVREGTPTTDLAERARRMGAIVDPLLQVRPLRSLAVFERTAPWYADFFDHERRDDPYWLALSPQSHFADVSLPMIHVGGWYDIQLTSTIRSYLGMRAAAATEQARRHQRMIVGPWPHWTPHSGVVGQVDFGAGATLDVTALRTAWFGHWLQRRPSRVGSPGTELEFAL